MAAVYEALDTRLDRECAVKIMHPGLGDDGAFAERFKREARAAARLSHPNVVSVFDQGEDPTVDGALYLVMELVPGHTLRDVIRDEAPMQPARAVALIEPVVSALAAAHRAGLVHRDIKPENVLISDEQSEGRVKVADFGLAKAVSADTQHTATGGVIIGTVSYLAPELVVDGTCDARVDVYAVGVMLYELLTGRKPHEGESPIAVAYKHVHEDVPPPSRLVPGIPPYVDALVARATARDRAQRPADAGVLLHQLHRVAPGAGRRGLGRRGAHHRPDAARRPLRSPTRPPPSSCCRSPRTSSSSHRLRRSRTSARPTVAPPPDRPGRRRATGHAGRGAARSCSSVALVIALAAGLGAYWFGWARYTATPGVLGHDPDRGRPPARQGRADGDGRPAGVLRERAQGPRRRDRPRPRRAGARPRHRHPHPVQGQGAAPRAEGRAASTVDQAQDALPGPHT